MTTEQALDLKIGDVVLLKRYKCLYKVVDVTMDSSGLIPTITLKKPGRGNRFKWSVFPSEIEKPN